MKNNLLLIAGITFLYFWLKDSRDKSGEATLKGKIGPYKVNPQKIVDSLMPWVNVHPIAKEAVKRATTKALEGVIGFDDSNVIDADYRRVK